MGALFGLICLGVAIAALSKAGAAARMQRELSTEVDALGNRLRFLEERVRRDLAGPPPAVPLEPAPEVPATRSEGARPSGLDATPPSAPPPGLDATPPSAPPSGLEATPPSAPPPGLDATPPPPAPLPGLLPPGAEPVPELVSEPAAGEAGVEQAPSALSEPVAAPPPTRPVPPPPVVSGRPPAPPPRPAISLEELVGVKGAAILGGIVLALAGLVLFRHAIREGWVSPALRVVAGTVVGLGSIVFAQTRRARSYPVTAQSLAGAGSAILYAAFWAAHGLYGLIGAELGWFLLVAVTAATCTLAARHDSLLIALLGLAGGFATPLLLSTGSDRPIALFGYLLLLDLGLLALARVRGWGVLAVLSLLGTGFYQLAWIGVRMGPERVGLGVAILLVFALLFALAGRGAPKEQRRSWDAAQAAALLFPLVFGLYLAARASLAPDFRPVAAMLLLINVGAAWLGRRGRPTLSASVAAGALPVVAIWLAREAPTTARFVEGGAVLVLLAGVHHLAFEPDRGKAAGESNGRAARVAGVGAAVVVGVAHLAAPGAVSPWVGLGATVLLAVLLLRQSGAEGGRGLALVASAALALAAAGPLLRDLPGEAFPPILRWLAAAGLLAAALQGWALGVARGAARRETEHGAAGVALAMAVALAFAPGLQLMPPLAALGGGLAFVALVALPATRLDRGGWYLAASVAFALLLSVWTVGRSTLAADAGDARTGLLLGTLGVAALAAWPLGTAPAFRGGRTAWYGAALAAPLAFPALRRLFRVGVSTEADAVPAVVLAAILVGVMAVARRQWPEDDPVGRSAAAWLGAVALAFIAAAIPLQLRNEWVTIGWALEGVAVLLLWRRLDHAGLKWFAALLFAAVSVRLLANPWVLDYQDRGPWRIVNWIAYTYLVPAGALVAAAAVLRPLEVARLRPIERSLHGANALLSAMFGFAAVAIGFAWVNLAVFDWYGDGPTLRIAWERMQARDLTLSLCWALYAVFLLAFGMARSSRGLRWVSLVLLLGTIGKVFLYDLGALEDLYLVASLLGLAISLMGVSFAYQRWVFRDSGEAAAPPASQEPPEPAVPEPPPPEPSPAVEPAGQEAP